MPTMFEKLREVANQLTPRQKLQLAGAVLATVALVWGVGQYATRIRYQVLFSGLEPEDGAQVAVELENRNVPHKIRAGGRIIEVPTGQVDELRMELAGEGLPRGGGVGFEIFDKPAFGLSDFVQNVNYRRALERELGRSIQSIDSVESARVHLALPPESVFAGEENKASASVVVRLRGDGKLPSERVRAITHLVASGVEGLESSRVSVVDGHGRMLTDGETEGDETLSASQVDAKRALEARIEGILISILEPVVGPEKVRARATVELETARVERVEETYDPAGAVVRSEQKSKTRNRGGASGGVPGSESNLPGGTPASAGSAGQQDSQSSTTNFEINKTVATIAEPRGGLLRQSVAVVVDHARVVSEDDEGNEVEESNPRTEDEMRRITSLVRAAVGIDESRGDQLIVENIPFDETLATDADAGGLDWIHLLLQILRFAALPLAVLLIAILVIRPGIAALRGLSTPRVASSSDTPPTVAELQARLGQTELGEGQGSTLRQRLIEAAAQDPEAAALVVRGWLNVQGGD